MTSKMCGKCHKTKQLKEFYKNRSAKDGYQNMCKLCKHEYNRQYRKKNNVKAKAWDKRAREKIKKHNPQKYKKRYRNSQLKYNYNITLTEYNAIFEKQNGCCKICEHHQSGLNVALAVDHDHKTGKIRGLLCSLCNASLGRYEKYYDAIQEYIAKESK